MATAEEIEPGTITLLITEATGAHFRLPASPVDTVGHVGCGGGAERCERWAAGQLGQQRAARLVFENTKLHDDGITLAELKIEVSKVVLGLAPQDPAEGARLRSVAKVATCSDGVRNGTFDKPFNEWTGVGPFLAASSCAAGPPWSWDITRPHRSPWCAPGTRKHRPRPLVPALAGRQSARVPRGEARTQPFRRRVDGLGDRCWRRRAGHRAP